MNPAYLLPRVVRHFLREDLVRFLLLRSLIIKPGMETTAPGAAVDRYARVLQDRGDSLTGKRVLVFGYGGRFDIGVSLLESGAGHVVLCDKHAGPDDRHNASLLARHARYVWLVEGRPRPRAELMELWQADIRQLQPSETSTRFDLVISNSVYEHLEDAEGSTHALARWSDSNVIQIHFVDLRDHYFRYPFEMLCYSEAAWRKWLNPTSNHNRLRLWEYRHMFEAQFGEVDIEILGRDQVAFERARPRLRPEFTSGNPMEDSATLIRIIARLPRS